MYQRQFRVGWAQVDFNGHRRNSAYLDWCSDIRATFFSDHGIPAPEFSRQAFGPVIRRDATEYFRELHLLELRTRRLMLPPAAIANAVIRLARIDG